MQKLATLGVQPGVCWQQVADGQRPMDSAQQRFRNTPGVQPSVCWHPLNNIEQPP